MIEWPLSDMTSIIDLFSSHRITESMILPWIRMNVGKIQVDNAKDPKVGILTFSSLSFVAGDPHTQEAENLILDFPPMNVLIVPHDEWVSLVKEKWGTKLKVQHRTRMDPCQLDLRHMRDLKKKLPEGYSLEALDLETFRSSDKRLVETLHETQTSFVGFKEKGFGFCIRHQDEVVSVAYTCFPFDKHFEIQVNTHSNEKYRKKGLATVVSAALIEYALMNELVPEWDAANPISVRLAEKLGYTNPRSYDVYFWLESR